ncbi:DUF192 domain-containing protein [Archangium sp.]|uniref:DUF192 domain-containing protein n=1 Tax=Archangium sp. TaxID=1872627 RepID=UPI002D425968|nr:DUF192 domain-containing protein [Archangium sp.]HYO57276.1 DUF192 domain-containing protein [Archangium sp.]
MSRHWLRGLCAVLLVTACQAPEAKDRPSPPAGRKVTDVSAEEYVGPTLPRARVLLEDAFGGVHRVDVEVAATPETRTRGLMWRKELPAGQGMLFIFPEEEVQGFWMRNTLIPLDMLFINSAGKIVGIVERAEPRTLTSRSVGVPGRYVLEVPGGWCQANGITRGGTARFQGLENIQVVP